jgi:putative spermidine/putrescine transport system substrate-binding protein
MRRRSFLQGSAAVAGTLAMPYVARAQSKQIVLAAFGGRYQDAMRAAWYQPFERATGIKVVEVSGISLAKVRAMARSGNMEWDAFVAVPAEMLVLANQGLLAKIDYAQFDKTLLDVLDARVKQPYGFGGMYISQVIGYNTNAFPKGTRHPDSWAEVWDTKTFPGKRMFPEGDYSVNPIEAALMADGVPMDKVYPIDLERAYRSMTRIRPATLKWVNSSSAVPQALVAGEISCGLVNSGRLVELRTQGAPVDLTWNQGIVFLDYWAVPKGGPNFDGAMKFIEFASRAEQQANFTKDMPAGPIHPHAIEMMSAEERARVPSAPENFKKQLFLDAAWWAAPSPNGKSNYDVNVEMWNRWVLQ